MYIVVGVWSVAIIEGWRWAAVEATTEKVINNKGAIPHEVSKFRF